jgi:hypothetical protein
MSLKEDMQEAVIAKLALDSKRVFIIGDAPEPNWIFAFPLNKIIIEALPGEVEESPSD